VLTLDYIADKVCVELKSLKLYVWSFRNEGPSTRTSPTASSTTW
jgi:NADPH-dependent 7-cyano-7-deazaguanine reductase QueF